MTGTPNSCLGIKGQAQHGAQRRLVLESPLCHLPGENAHAFHWIVRFESDFLKHRRRSFGSEHAHIGEQALLARKVSVGGSPRDLPHLGTSATVGSRPCLTSSAAASSRSVQISGLALSSFTWAGAAALTIRRDGALSSLTDVHFLLLSNSVSFARRRAPPPVAGAPATTRSGVASRGRKSSAR